MRINEADRRDARGQVLPVDQAKHGHVDVAVTLDNLGVERDTVFNEWKTDGDIRPGNDRLRLQCVLHDVVAGYDVVVLDQDTGPDNRAIGLHHSKNAVSHHVVRHTMPPQKSGVRTRSMTTTPPAGG